MLAWLAQRYGTDLDGAREIAERPAVMGRPDGVEIDVDKQLRANSFDAHRLVALGLAQGGPALQAAVLERLYSAHFTEGKAIDDIETLQRLGAEAGLDGRRVSAVLAGDEYADHVRADEEAAVDIGITGVPFFMANRRVGAVRRAPGRGHRPADRGRDRRRARVAERRRLTRRGRRQVSRAERWALGREGALEVGQRRSAEQHEPHQRRCRRRPRRSVAQLRTASTAIRRDLGGAPAVDARAHRREGDRPRAPTSRATSRLRVKQDASRAGSVWPRCRFGPTVWITQRAGRSPAPVATASPTSRPSRCVVLRSRRHASSSRGPAAAWIAPSTPPPPSSAEFAALTMASTRSVVMSPRTASRVTTHPRYAARSTRCAPAYGEAAWAPAQPVRAGDGSGVDGEEHEGREQHEVDATLQPRRAAGHHGEHADDHGQGEQHHLRRAEARAAAGRRARSRRSRWRGWSGRCWPWPTRGRG